MQLTTRQSGFTWKDAWSVIYRVLSPAISGAQSKKVTWMNTRSSSVRLALRQIAALMKPGCITTVCGSTCHRTTTRQHLTRKHHKGSTTHVFRCIGMARWPSVRLTS